MATLGTTKVSLKFVALSTFPENNTVVPRISRSGYHQVLPQPNPLRCGMLESFPQDPQPYGLIH